MAKTWQVALIMKSSQRYDRRIVRGVAARVHETGNWSLYVEEDPDLRIPEMKDWHWDGIIADFDDRKTAETVSGLKIPIVGIGGGYGWYDDNSGIPYVTTDNQAMGRLGAEHLLDCGFTRFAFCGLPRTQIIGWSVERGQAFRGRIEEAGFSCSVFTGRRGTARQWGKLQSELSEWLVSLEKPVGLMTCNDIRARHVIEACRNLGIRVPDDIAVIGVDNDEVMCELTNPPLTSIEQGSRQIGYEAALLLERLMAGKKVPRLRTLLEPENIVVRQSTDTLAIEDDNVGRAVAFIREHACDPIQVSDVLDLVDLSRSTLDKQFHTTLGRTIHAEMQRVKIEQAKRLLTKTAIPIKHVAERCGFEYLQYFTTVFRQHTGHTPAEYRRGPRA